MKLSLLVTFIMLFSPHLSAMDEYEYDELLEKHMESGHLTPEEVDHQKFEHINSKKYHNEFSKQVRGVASKLNEPQNVLHLVNPEIEILAD